MKEVVRRHPHGVTYESEFLYGAFINALIPFVSVAATVCFLIIAPYEGYKQRRGVTSDKRPCPERTTDIPVAATPCPSCTARVPSTASG